MSKYYYHGVKRGDILEKTLDIFQKGGIKCMPGARKIGFNGLDHVSICTKEPEEEYSRHFINMFKIVFVLLFLIQWRLLNQKLLKMLINGIVLNFLDI